MRSGEEANDTRRVVARFLADLKLVLAPRMFWRVARGMFADGGMDFAVQMAYFLLLFLFPFLLFLVNVAGLVIDDPASTIAGVAADAKGFLPPEVIGLLTGYLSGALRDATLPIFLFSSLFALLTGLSAVQHIVTETDRAYGLEETRPLWKRLGIALLSVLGFALFVAIVMFLVLSPEIWDYAHRAVGLPDSLDSLWSALRLVIAFVMLTLAFAVLYHAAPNANPPFRLVSVGGLMTAVFLIVASKIFQLWAALLFRPTQLYGQLGGGIVLLLWLLAVGLVIRFGIEVNAQLARARKEQESRGRQEP